MIPAFKQVMTNDRLQNQIQDNIAFTLKLIQSNPIVDGILLNGVNNEGYSIGVGVTTIDHTLGRMPLGVLVIYNNSATAVVNPNVFTETTIRLNATAATIVKLYVF